MQHSDEKNKIGIVIPRDKLSKQALRNLIEEFILREGTDYGRREYELDEKVEQINKQLESKYLVVMFDPELENTTLIRIEDLRRLQQQNFEIVNPPANL